MEMSRIMGAPHRARATALGITSALGLMAFATSTVNAAAPPPAAPTGSTPVFTAIRSTVDAGGARSSGGGFVVEGTVGQHDAEPLQPSVGGAFAVTGGFWTGVVSAPPPGDAIFSNGFEGT